MDTIIKLALGAIGWLILSLPVALFFGRMASRKWHPTVGEPKAPVLTIVR